MVHRLFLISLLVFCTLQQINPTTLPPLSSGLGSNNNGFLSSINTQCGFPFALQNGRCVCIGILTQSGLCVLNGTQPTPIESFASFGSSGNSGFQAITPAQSARTVIQPPVTNTQPSQSVFTPTQLPSLTQNFQPSPSLPSIFSQSNNVGPFPSNSGGTPQTLSGGISPTPLPTVIGGSSAFPDSTFNSFGQQIFTPIPTNPNNLPSIFATQNAQVSSLRTIRRSLDGTGNNAANPFLGSANQNLLRMTNPNYIDGISAVDPSLPNPRTVSNTVGKVNGAPTPSIFRWSMVFQAYGQFLDHDMSFTLTESTPMNIPVPRCDPDFDRQCSGQQVLGFTRSINSASSQFFRAPKQMPNSKSSFIDGSQIYGVNATFLASLRTFSQGKLRLTPDGMIISQAGSLLTGDTRANENTLLTAFHILFAREHNRLCDRIIRQTPSLSDEDIFQSARLYVIGLLQKITMDQYLPLVLGQQFWNSNVGQYSGYDPSINPNIFTQFSTAAYRYGHMCLGTPFSTVNRNGQILQTFPLMNLFSRPDLLTGTSFDSFWAGMGKSLTKQRDIAMIDDFRSLSLGSGANAFLLDLYASDIQRARDHGLSDYNTLRAALKLPRVSDPSQITPNPQLANQLRSLYPNINTMDSFVGMMAQPSLQGGAVGTTAVAIIALQFKNLRGGDSLWYEKAYPAAIVNEIKNTFLGDIINRNSAIGNFPKAAFIQF